MKIDQIELVPGAEIHTCINQIPDKADASFVLAFSDRNLFADTKWLSAVKGLYPNAQVISCSTSGDISDIRVSTDRIVATAVQTERSNIKIYAALCSSAGNTANVAEKMASVIEPADLRHVFLISDGQLVNGTDLIESFNKNLPANVTVSGGLAGDVARFQKTLVGLDADIKEGNIIALCFYGSQIKVGLGTFGGWDTFGPERVITRSKDNVLFELDGKNALELYKTYLGEKAKDLPGAALLYPLRITTADSKAGVVRTILNVSETDQSMTFAGDMPQGARAQLMKANFDKLIEGAGTAAENTLDYNPGEAPELALLVSCVGRRLVLGQRTEEELEAVREALGDTTVLAGFYSYGELCASAKGIPSDLHNQTMTITTFSEL